MWKKKNKMPQLGRLEQAVQILNTCRIKIDVAKEKIETETDPIKLKGHQS